MPRLKPLFEARPLPWTAHARLDDKVDVLDAENRYVFMADWSMSLREWQELLDRLNGTSQATGAARLEPALTG